MSRKGANFGYMAKRHGTLEKRRADDRMRIRQAKAAETFGQRPPLDIDAELARLDRMSRRD